MRLPVCHAVFVACLLSLSPKPAAQEDVKTVRVFVFAGQSNMVGSDSKAADVDSFPPFVHAAEAQPQVRFWYVIGREDKLRSDGWVALQPVDGIVGPELTFAREVAAHTKAPLAIVKVAAGGTTLGRDWNPDQPGGFELYPQALATVRAAVADLDRRHVKWRLEGFVWHQGENDMFDEGFRKSYAANLTRFFACWRRDLDAPRLHFYVGELCTKTVWGMDNRAPMYAIAEAQHQVADQDALVDYVPTSQVAVKIGGDGGLHYHYGTLGQLEHGVEHARAYLRSCGIDTHVARPLARWPYPEGATVDLYVLAGHRNMEGERAFVQQLAAVKGGKVLRADRSDVAFRYSVGGGVQASDGWEPLGPAGLYDTFGPELSFGRRLAAQPSTHVAIAKFTHSGSQIVDWTPKGSVASGRNLYPAFLAFVRESIADLERRGHHVRLAGIVYHLGENDMAWAPHRRQAAKWFGELIAATRTDLALPDLRWFVSQQRPTAQKDLDAIDVVAGVRALAAGAKNVVHVEVFDPPPQPEQLVFDTAGVVWLGQRLAEAVLRAER
ncbi:MAG: sialate O-acetylesterase [Planctomycetota bacterium]